jgi:hypothetical protein
MAQDWTCEMISRADGLTSHFVESLSLSPDGAYRSRATITATSATTKATVNLEWAGRWTLSQMTFHRTFSALKATSGEVNGRALAQERLDRAASEFRRGPTAEDGDVLSLSENAMSISTAAEPMTCRR